MIKNEIAKQTDFFTKIYLGEPSKLKSAETWEKFPSGDDPPAPYQTWDFFELGNFFKWNDPPYMELGTFFELWNILKMLKTI